MANFAEVVSFDSVRMIETNDPVLGGNPEVGQQVNSPTNYAYRALVNRTAWLKAQLEALVIPPAPDAASTTLAGIVRLSTIREAETGTLTTVAVTPAGLQAALNALDIGGVDFASNPEVQAGTVADKAISPAGLSSRTATESRTGLVKKATSSQASNRTDNQVYMTPLRTDAAINARNATEGRRGSIEIATTNEATGGTNDNRAMTSEKTLALIRHSNAQSSTTQRGTAQKATQSEVDAGTNTEKHLTPKTFNDADQIASVRPNATATLSVANTSTTIIKNIVIGDLLFLKFQWNSSGNLWYQKDITIGGAAWRLLNVMRDDNFSTTNPSASNSTGTHPRITNQVFNNNSTVFRISSADTITQNDAVSIIAVKV